jgi:hypothetical protein
VAENGITDVVEMRHFAIVKEEAVFEFGGITEDTVASGNHMLPKIGSTADDRSGANPGRSLDNGVGFDDGPGCHVNPRADGCGRMNRSMDEGSFGRFEKTVEIGLQFPQSRPDRFSLREKRNVIGFGKIEIVRGRKHNQGKLPSQGSGIRENFERRTGNMDRGKLGGISKDLPQPAICPDGQTRYEWKEQVLYPPGIFTQQGAMPDPTG